MKQSRVQRFVVPIIVGYAVSKVFAKLKFE